MEKYRCSKQNPQSVTQSGTNSSTLSTESSTSPPSLKKPRTQPSNPKKHYHESWQFQWTSLPKNDPNLIRTVIPGPFVHPKLVKALPYIVTSMCEACRGSNDKYDTPPLRKLRNGIPDPWLEYLTWRKNVQDEDRLALRDVRLCEEYLRLTRHLWYVKGLAMVQGIPDPWKYDVRCECLSYAKEPKLRAKEKTKKKKKKVEVVEKVDEEPIIAIEKYCNVFKKDEEIKETRKRKDKAEVCKKSLNEFDKIKIELSEFDKQLKLREVERNRALGERCKRPRTRRKKAVTLEREEELRCLKKPVKNKVEILETRFEPEKRCTEAKESKREKIERIPKWQNLKVASAKKKNSTTPIREASSKKRVCADGRFGWSPRKFENVSPKRPTTSNRSPANLDKKSLEKIVQDIDTRIAVTKDAIKSPEVVRKIRCFDKESCARRRALRSARSQLLDVERKKGGGDIEICMDIKVIDLRKRDTGDDGASSGGDDDDGEVLKIDSEKLFRRSNNNLSRLEVLDDNENEDSQRYRETSPINAVAKRPSDERLLIVESISDDDEQ